MCVGDGGGQLGQGDQTGRDGNISLELYKSMKKVSIKLNKGEIFRITNYLTY